MAYKRLVLLFVGTMAICLDHRQCGAGCRVFWAHSILICTDLRTDIHHKLGRQSAYS